VSPLAGIKAKVSPQTMVLYAKGGDAKGDSTAGFEEAVNVAKQADVAIVVVGETDDMVGEAASRSTLDLPGRQLELVQAIHATGKPTVVVLVNGRPLSIGWIAGNVPAILESWMGGSQGGHAIADVLFGDVNPGGKLPVTFPRSVGQIPMYYNYLNTGRPPEAQNKYTSKYLDMPWTPLFPFGFGLSYTKFKISNLQLSAPRIAASGKLTVSVEVENSGQRAGDEVVQLYVRDPVASLSRPVKELKGFQRVTLQPGEKRRVEFVLDREHLGFWNRQMRFVVEPGEFRVMVGSNSAEVLEAKFQVTAN
jgi:beta-glucosidase